MAKAAPECAPERMNAEDYLFILYTSGSTGKPKGVVHSTAGYLLWSALTHKYVFDIHERRRLFLHGGHRLGDRPQLCGLRPAVQRRHDADVRGCADLAGRRAASGKSSRSSR
jgi:acyl-CoA synthetase (AMP-forming)/AMP-acid ligase II